MKPETAETYFQLPAELLPLLKQKCLEMESEIMSLSPIDFDQFPDTTARRLHAHNILKSDNPLFLSLKTIIRENLPEPLNSMPLFVTCWVNILRDNQPLGPHSHDDDPDKYVTGVIFLTDSGGDFVFEKTGQKVKPKAGVGMIFHSSRKHKVERGGAGEIRISLAFDIRGSRKTDLWTDL